MIKPIALAILAALTVLAAIEVLTYRTDAKAQWLAYLNTREAEREALPAAAHPGCQDLWIFPVRY